MYDELLWKVENCPKRHWVDKGPESTIEAVLNEFAVEQAMNFADSLSFGPVYALCVCGILRAGLVDYQGEPDRACAPRTRACRDDAGTSHLVALPAGIY